MLGALAHPTGVFGRVFEQIINLNLVKRSGQSSRHGR